MIENQTVYLKLRAKPNIDEIKNDLSELQAKIKDVFDTVDYMSEKVYKIGLDIKALDGSQLTNEQRE